MYFTGAESTTSQYSLVQSRLIVVLSPAAASNNFDLAATTYPFAMYVNRRQGHQRTRSGVQKPSHSLSSGYAAHWLGLPGRAVGLNAR